MRWANLNRSEQTIYRATSAFLVGRLAQRETIDWALKLTTADAAKRAAVLDLLDRPQGPKLPEPWLSGWRLIEESWNSSPPATHHLTGSFLTRQRLRSGDRSQSLIQALLEQVAPRLTVKPLSELHLTYAKPPARPKAAEHLFSAGISSGELVDPDELGIADLRDVDFLVSLGRALDAAVLNGIDIAQRIGWHSEHGFWRLGGLNRVSYVGESNRRSNEHEPDQFHTGIAPSVKLLHAVVERLAEVDLLRATEFVRRWRLTRTPVHLRLWAALSKDPRVTEAVEVAAVLRELNDRQFWNLHDYPEIAELRADRFKEFDRRGQLAVLRRLRKKPPRNYWGKDANDERVTIGQRYWAARELRRIEVAGGVLPNEDKVWLEEAAREFADLGNSMRGDEGFLGTQKAQFIAPNPDVKYDAYSGEERLKALEHSLAMSQKTWEDDPSQRAADWIREGDHTDKILGDFETTTDGGAHYLRVWERFGWADSPKGDDHDIDRIQHSQRVAALLEKLPQETIRNAIDGISHWMSTWEKSFATASAFFSIWSKVWPLAVEATNSQTEEDEAADLNTVTKPSGDHEPFDLDTLNTPAGKLVGVFLSVCPNINKEDRPFDTNVPLRQMRDLVISASGRAGLIARHRLIEALPYFLRADAAWTREHLITPLKSPSTHALPLWRAIGRRTHFQEVLAIIGSEMAERAIDRRLGRETRRSLVFSLVIESLHALREKRAPSVPYALIQQTLRTVDDEVRAHAAHTVKRFIEGVGTQVNKLDPLSREGVFASAATPFLQKVWPQERSLITPGVSKALAQLPAATRAAFASAVDAVEPFLVPFDCWSMVDYGLFGEDDGKPKLSLIDSNEKAAAFLRLLDRTIGTAEGSVVPLDLPDALSQIRTAAPRLAQAPSYVRLATVARRL